jgi:hypothetical protein
MVMCAAFAKGVEGLITVAGDVAGLIWPHPSLITKK